MARRKQINTSEEDIQFLESHLAGTLKPVAPSKETFRRLNKRIRMPSREEVNFRFSDWRRLFVVFGGVVSGMLLLITLARAFYYLAGRSRGSL
jgi:hypothetical protein